MSRSRRETLCQILLALLLLTSYAYFLPRRVDWNQNGRIDLVFALVDQGRLEIDDYVGNTGDYAHFGGHYYSDKAPGTAFLGVPFYWLFRILANAPAIGPLLQRLAAGAAPGPASPQELAGLFPWRGYFALALYAVTLGAVSIPSTILGILLYRLARQWGAGMADAALLTVVYGLGTMAFPYGAALYGHMLAAACLFGAFYILQGLPARGVRAFPLFAAGFLLGWSIITEYPVALGVAAIGLYAIFTLRRWQPILWILAGGAVPILLLAGYDYATFGTLLPVGYAYSELWVEEHSTGFMSLTAPSFARLWGITFSPYRGLFFLSPALLGLFPGLAVWWREKTRRPEWWAVVAVIVLFLLFNASSVMWWGGFAVGPRYIASAMPFIALPIAFWLKKGGWRRILFGILGLLSIAQVWVQTIASVKFYPPEMYRFPTIEFALPALQRGEIALNLGMALGLQGLTSLAPLLFILAVLLVGLASTCRPAEGRTR